ncbi:hypothetical protein CgunFtcFv8_025066 [Champsocephalus gunnari]|nr:hypothetical protein CgunFtcFv8_025066 [Champsocephalus gunnari]
MPLMSTACQLNVKHRHVPVLPADDGWLRLPVVQVYCSGCSPSPQTNLCFSSNLSTSTSPSLFCSVPSSQTSTLSRDPACPFSSAAGWAE